MREIETRLSFDRGERLIVTETIQDVEDILDRNQTLRALEQRSDWGRHVAEIPNVILVRWLNEEYARGNVALRMYTKQFDEIVARKLKDPEWAYLRVDGPSHKVGYGR